MPRWLWVTLLVLVALIFWAAHRSPTPLTASALNGNGAVVCALPPAFTDPDQPLQSPADARMPPFRLAKATVTPLAGFSLQAYVLSKENYSFDTAANYSPSDLALGWGPMAKPQVSDKLDISQSGRWYHYRWGAEGPPISLDQIIRNSANMHMIPADSNVAATLKRVNPGDTVRINGWLVRVDGDDGWHWQSSLTREDSGDGACEVVYVCSIVKR